MKKIIVLLLTISLFTSCENESIEDENTNNTSNTTNPGNTNGSTLVLSKYSLNYPSGNSVEHNFDGSKETFFTRNGNTIGEYEYDSQNRMTKHSRLDENTGEIEKSYTFTYDSNSTLTSVLEFTNIGTHTRDITYSGNNITSQIQENSDTLNTIVFQLDTNGYIDRFEQIGEDGTLKYSIDFTQDTNGNYTDLTVNALFGGNYYTTNYAYSYQDINNPVEPHFQEYFLQNLIIYGRLDFGNIPLIQLSRTLGPDMITTTQYPEGTPEQSQYYFEYTVNSDNYPTQALTRNVADNNIISLTTEFTY